MKQKYGIFLVISSFVIILLVYNQAAQARTLSQELDILATKDQKLNVIDKANNNSETYNHIRETCQNKLKFYDTLEACITFFEKFNYHMNLLWNESHEQIEEIGK
jgi:ABC-type antimicrobial peptide transport system permease subunit